MSVITRDNKIEYFLRRREEEYSLNAVSATPPVSEGSAVVCPLLHGFALTIVRASPAVKHGAPPPEAALGGCGCGGGAVRVSTKAYIP